MLLPTPVCVQKSQLGDPSRTEKLYGFCKAIIIFANIGLILCRTTNLRFLHSLPIPGKQASPFLFTSNASEPCAEQDSRVTSTALLLVAW